MPFPKNQIARMRGEYPGEAGADWGYGATARPEADEHYMRSQPAEGLRGSSQPAEGLRGEDKQQGELRDQTSNMREPERGEQAETQRSRHQDLQQGADVRGNPPMVQGSDAMDALPEGLKRERKGPYDKNLGRGEDATQVPKNWTGRM